MNLQLCAKSWVICVFRQPITSNSSYMLETKLMRCLCLVLLPCQRYSSLLRFYLVQQRCPFTQRTHAHTHQFRKAKNVLYMILIKRPLLINAITHVHMCSFFLLGNQVSSSLCGHRLVCVARSYDHSAVHAEAHLSTWLHALLRQPIRSSGDSSTFRLSALPRKPKGISWVLIAVARRISFRSQRASGLAIIVKCSAQFVIEHLHIDHIPSTLTLASMIVCGGVTSIERLWVVQFSQPIERLYLFSLVSQFGDWSWQLFGACELRRFSCCVSPRVLTIKYKPHLPSSVPSSDKSLPCFICHSMPHRPTRFNSH